MTIFSDRTLSTKRLPKSQTLLLNSHPSPSKLNIKLKTHSLTSLNIPLETFAGLKRTSTSSFRNDYQKNTVGSVDLSSKMQQQSDDADSSHFPLTEPLISIVLIDKQRPSIEQECRQILQHRSRVSTSFITSTSLNDSVARLRRNGYRPNIRQSLQTVDKITERKPRLSLSHNRSIPKFSLRELPSIPSRSASVINQFEQSAHSGISPFTSLPEIRSFVAQNCIDNLQTINNKSKSPPSSTSPSWTKSSSWSWKSCNAIHSTAVQNEHIKPNGSQQEQQHHIDDQSRFELPVIIESPLQQRSSLQTIRPECHHSPTRLIDKHRSNLFFRSNQIPRNSPRLYQKKNSFPHSISNYEVSPSALSSQPTPRYPSIPLLVSPHHKNTDQSYPLYLSPLATFDDDNDSISTDSSFRSCIDSINELSEMNTTELSSILENSFPEMSSSYDLHGTTVNETTKSSRSSVRHLCVLQ